MQPKYQNGNVSAFCSVCESVSTFEAISNGNHEFGSIVMDDPVSKGWKSPVRHRRFVFRLLRCAGCGRAGLATISDAGRVTDGTLVDFYPYSIENLSLPTEVPEGIVNEFREAEKDASIGSYRSACAMLRSALEKTLVTNGYTNESLKNAGKRTNLYSRIELANEDGVLTDSRRRRAHDEIRVLGNDVLHEEWKNVVAEDFELAHKYTQRVIEDFYDSRAEVLTILKAKGRPLT